MSCQKQATSRYVWNRLLHVIFVYKKFVMYNFLQGDVLKILGVAMIYFFTIKYQLLIWNLNRILNCSSIWKNTIQCIYRIPVRIHFSNIHNCWIVEKDRKLHSFMLLEQPYWVLLSCNMERTNFVLFYKCHNLCLPQTGSKMCHYQWLGS